MKPNPELALQVACNYGQIDDNHHKAWVIDQMVRAITGDGYQQWVDLYRSGEDGPRTYEWNIGIAP